MKKVLDFVQRFDLLPRYELLLAAASGGMDSMCLLDFLYENGYRVCAAHYNHQLRGQEADMDEDLVRAWCAARRIPLCVGTGDVAAYAGENGLTIEEAARKLRYDFLNTVAGQTGAARIVTAHHANDNAETVLFHLARGTGMAGLAGITIASRLYSGTCTSGESAEMDAIAAVIVGGTSMSGGKGSVVGTVFGMLIIAVMNNLLNLLGVPPFLREAFKGAIIIAAVLLQRKSSDN